MIKTIPLPPNCKAITVESYDPKIDFIIEEPEPPNQPPVVSATSPGTVMLPIDNVVLKGSAHDLDGTIVSTKWEQISGPDFTGAQKGIDYELSNLIEGDHSFKFSATDNKGATQEQIVSLKVLPAAPPPVTKIFPITVTPRTDNVRIPGSGLYTWNYNNVIPTLPASDEYRRYTWYDIDKGVNAPAYNWSAFDSEVNNAIKNGKKFSFGIMGLYSGLGYKSVGGGTISCPEWVHNGMQKEANKDWLFNGAWIPNFNSQTWLGALENRCNATREHIESKGFKKHINYIDIRGYGEWGEWHSQDWTDKEPAGRKATADTLKAIIDIYIKCFPDYQLVIIDNAFDPGNYAKMPPEVIYHALTAKNKVGLLGFRVDHYGDPGMDQTLSKNPGSYNGLQFSQAILDRWKYAPIVGEPNNDPKNATYSDLVREVQLYHTSLLGNGNVPSPTQAKANMLAAEKIMGAKIGVTGGNVELKNGRIYFSVDWENTGNVPVYDTDWLVEFAIGSTKIASKFKPKGFLPSNVTQVRIAEDFDIPPIPAGTYDLKISVTDPSGARKTNLPLNSNIACKITV